LDGLTEEDLVEIRQALEKDSSTEALYAVEIALERLGYKRVSRVSKYDIYLSSREDAPELDALVQLRDALKKKAKEGGN
jgi:hypothetical protein